MHLNYYNIKVTDSNNKLIYSYANDDSKTDNGTYKDIPLGTMNSSANTENKIINVTVSVNKSLKNSDAAQYAEKLDWSIVSSVKKTETAETPKATEEVAKETTAPTTEVTAKETTNPSVKEDKNGVVTLAQGEYICGEDIDPGRYTMTGNGKVHVYTENGELKSTIALKDKNSSANGVEEYLINLTNGEKIKVESETNSHRILQLRPQNRKQPQQQVHRQKLQLSRQPHRKQRLNRQRTILRQGITLLS